eukprot:scaffold87489_cov21-Cyclotella_meneghiniana.AAC.1
MNYSLPVSAVSVPDDKAQTAGFIVAAASSLSERTNDEDQRSIVTNYDYTAYVPPSCGEFYGSFGELTAIDGNDDDDNIGSKMTIMIPSVHSDETSDAGETFEAGPLSGLRFKQHDDDNNGKNNAHYIVTDEYDGTAFRKKSLFARINRLLTGRKLSRRRDKNKTWNKVIDENNKTDKKEQTANKADLRRRCFNSKKQQQSNNFDSVSVENDPTTPTAVNTNVPSMLTPDTSPDSNDNNVTPYGLDGCFIGGGTTAYYNNNDDGMTRGDGDYVSPPEMPSSSISSSAIINEEANVNTSLTNGMTTHHASLDNTTEEGGNTADVSPNNTVNEQPHPLTTPVVVGSDIEKSVTRISIDNKQRQLETVTRHTNDDKVTVDEKDDEIEVEYHGIVLPPLPPCLSSEESLLHLQGDTNTFTVQIESTSESKEMESVSSTTAAASAVKERQSSESSNVAKTMTFHEFSSFNEKSEEVKKFKSRGGRSHNKLGFAAFQHFNNPARTNIGSTDKSECDTTPDITAIAAPEREDEDVTILSPEYVIESQPERESTNTNASYNRAISIRTKNAVAEAQMRSRVERHPSGMRRSGRSAKLTYWIFGASRTNDTNSSFDNTDSDALSEDTTGTDLEDDTTARGDSLEDYDDRTETSNTIVSSDSTYLTTATNAGGGCGIRGA